MPLAGIIHLLVLRIAAVGSQILFAMLSLDETMALGLHEGDS